MASVGPYSRARDMTDPDPAVRSTLPVRGQTWQRVISDINAARAGFGHSSPIGGTGWLSADEETIASGASRTFIVPMVNVDNARTYVVRLIASSTAVKPTGATLTVTPTVLGTAGAATVCNVYGQGPLLAEFVVQVAATAGCAWGTYQVVIANAGPDTIRVVGLGCEALPLPNDFAGATTADLFLARSGAPIVLGAGAANAATLADHTSAGLGLMRTLITWMRSTSSPATFSGTTNLWLLDQPALAAPRFTGETTRPCAFAVRFSTSTPTGTSTIQVSVSGGGTTTLTVSNTTSVTTAYGVVDVPVETTATDGRSGGAWSDVNVKGNGSVLSVYAFALVDTTWNGVGDTAAPTIAGSVALGNILCCYYWAAAAYQWKRAGVAIGGATGQNYTCTGADTPGNLTCECTDELGNTHTSNTL